METSRPGCLSFLGQIIETTVTQYIEDSGCQLRELLLCCRKTGQGGLGKKKAWGSHGRSRTRLSQCAKGDRPQKKPEETLISQSR